MFFDERERMENMTGQFKKLRLVTAMVLAALMAALIPVQAGAIVPPALSAAEIKHLAHRETMKPALRKKRRSRRKF